MIERDRLDSWKEIGRYVDRGLKTCYRWEKKLGFPVHRINGKSTRSRVFAFKSEIDEWFQKKAKDENQKEILHIKD